MRWSIQICLIIDMKGYSLCIITHIEYAMCKDVLLLAGEYLSTVTVDDTLERVANTVS